MLEIERGKGARLGPAPRAGGPELGSCPFSTGLALSSALSPRQDLPAFAGLGHATSGCAGPCTGLQKIPYASIASSRPSSQVGDCSRAPLTGWLRPSHRLACRPLLSHSLMFLVNSFKFPVT